LIKGFSIMKRFGIVALIMLAFVATGCSRTKVIPQDQAHMNDSAFLQNSVKVKSGKPVKFIDNTGGAEHILVIGQNGTWQPTSGTPDQLNNNTGMTILPGQEMDVVFTTPGTFTVTCKVHPAMLLTVTVTP
jgi:plastocyanin